MINTPTGNIRLKLENIQQLAEVEGRLSNLQSEINIATKTLRGTKMECDRAVKEKAYQEELLENLKKDVEKLEQNKKEKGEELRVVVSNSDALNKKTKELTISNSNKDTELNKREKEVLQGEKDLLKKVDDFDVKNIQLLKDQVIIKLAKDAFEKASETVKW
mgnify:CR=1 FL=1